MSTGYTGGKIIEIWKTGFSSVSTAINAGNQFAELNAEENSQLYQNICLIQNETITFSLLHRGRSSATVADKANFLIGLYTDSTKTIFGTFSTTSSGTVTAPPIAQNGAIIPNVSDNNAGNGWVRYTGTVPYTGASGNRSVGFAAVSTAGDNNTIGNFLDDVQFAGKPVMEFTASSGGAAESETNPTTNPPKLRVVGLVPTGEISVPISVSGTAALGTDFNTTSGTSTFNITIPAGNYDGSDATSVFTIPFTVVNNNIPQGVRTINFTIQSSSSFFASSTTNCGSSPIIASSYTIYDDDFLSGKVWDDADNSANNTFTNINTGSETGTNAGGLLNAILVDSNNKVLVTTPVAADGTYTFVNVPLNQSNVKIILSTTAGTVGNTAPAVSLPPNWVNTSPLTTVAFNTGTNVSSKDFGIEQLPNTNNVSASPQINPGGNNTVQVPALSGIDLEDGNLGSDKSFKIISLPTNGTLYYNNIAVTANQVINNYDPTKLMIDPNDGEITVTFNVAAVDAAGKEDPTPATVTMPFATTYQVSPLAGKVVINEVLYNETGNTNNTSTNDEFIELYNPSSSSVDLSGLKLADGNLIANSTDGADGFTYIFPSGTTLQPGQYAILWIGKNTSDHQATEAAFQDWLNTSPKLNNSGDDVWLYDNQNKIIDYIAYGAGSGINAPPPSSLNLWDSSYQSTLAGASNGQSISLTANGKDTNVSACWEATTSENAKTRCPNYQPTIDTDSTGSRVTSVGKNNNGTTAKLLLVKRITRINNQDLTNIVDGRSDAGITDANYVPAPYDTDDDDSKWPADYLRGAINAGTVKPGDELEYTIYFLSKGLGSATNVKFCDLVPLSTTFIPTAFNSKTPNDGGLAATDQGIALALSSTTPTVYLSNVEDADRGRFYPANDSATPSYCGTNTNGAIVVNITRSSDLPNLPTATASGTPANSYGFVRFRAKVK